jgi:hypothetical protein
MSSTLSSQVLARLTCQQFLGVPGILLLVKRTNLVLSHIELFFDRDNNQLLFDRNFKCPITLHNLLKINFKIKLRVKTGNKYNEERKMVNIFQNPKWKQEYAIEINNKFEILKNLDDEDSIDNNINEKWENIKTIIKEIQQQLIEKDECKETF